jgi:membrane protein
MKIKKGWRKLFLGLSIAGSLVFGTTISVLADGYLTKTGVQIGSPLSEHNTLKYARIQIEGHTEKDAEGQTTTLVSTPTVYLSDDGTKRYIFSYSDTGRYSEWYEETEKGEWKKLSKEPTRITDDEKAEKAKSQYSATHNNAYTDVEAKVDPKTIPENAKSDYQKATEDAEHLEDYYDNPSLGRLNTSANLLQSVILKGESAQGFRSKTISMADLAKYPKADITDQEVDGQTKYVKVFEYGNLKNRETQSKVGSTTANMINVLAQQGWLQTSQKNEEKEAWYTTIWNSLANPVSAIVSIVAVAFGSVAEALTGVILAFIDAARNVIGFMFPDRLFGFAVQETTGFFTETTTGATGGLVATFKDFVEKVFGTGNIGLFKLIVTTMIAFWFIVSFVQFLWNWRKGGIKSAMEPLKHMSFRFIAYISFFTIIAGLNTLINQTLEENQNQPKKVEGLVFDSFKFMVATNGDVSIIYPDAYKQTQVGHVMSNKEIETTFLVDSKRVQEANKRVEDILGSEMNALIDKNKGKEAGANEYFDTITSGNQTWNVNDYISMISSSEATSSQIAAKRLPDGMSWDNKATVTYSVMPEQYWNQGENGNNADDIIKGGSFSFTGNPVFFQSLSDGDDGGESEKMVAVNGRFGIKYDPDIYNPFTVSMSQPFTYLYGASSNNSVATSNPANYTFYQNRHFIHDMTTGIGKHTDVPEDKSIKTNKTNGSKATNNDMKGEANDDKLNAKVLQYQNAYLIAMYNKYAGTNTSDPNVFYNQEVGNYGFATQSAMILMQSVYKNGSMTYTGYNSNFSKEDRGKAQTKDNVYMLRYNMPSSSNILANSVSRTAFGTIATFIITFGSALAIYKYGTGKLVKDAWVSISRFLKMGSYTGMFIYITAKIAYVIVFGTVKIFMTIIDSMINLAVNSFTNNFAIDSGATAVIGTLMVGLAIFFVKPTVRFMGVKQSIVSVIFGLVGILYDAVKRPLEKLDQFAYGTTSSYSDGSYDNSEQLYNTAERGVKHGARNIIATVGGAAAVMDYLNGDGSEGSKDKDGGNDGGSKTPIDFIKDKAARVGRNATSLAGKYGGKVLKGAAAVLPGGTAIMGAYYASKMAYKGGKSLYRYKQGQADRDSVIPGKGGKTPTGGVNAKAKPIPTSPASTREQLESKKGLGRTFEQKSLNYRRRGISTHSSRGGKIGRNMPTTRTASEQSDKVIPITQPVKRVPQSSVLNTAVRRVVKTPKKPRVTKPTDRDK